MVEGNRIKQLRIERNLTQQQLAEKLAIARATIAKYEINVNKMPGKLLVKFAKFFNVKTDFLLGLED